MSDFEQTHGPPSNNSSALSIAGEGRVSGSTIESSTPPSSNPSSTDLPQVSTLQQRKNRSRTHSRLFSNIDRRMATTTSLYEAGNESKLDIVVEELKEVRVAVVGGAGVGKTSLVQLMTGGRQYMPSPPQTTECSIHNREASSTLPAYVIADTIGQHNGQPNGAVQKFIAAMRPHVFLLCFLLGDDESLAEVLVVWSRFARSVFPNAPTLLVGIGSDQLVDPMNGMWRLNLVYKVQKVINAIDFIECSGLTGDGVERILHASLLLAQQSILLQESLVYPAPERSPSRPTSVFLSTRMAIPNPSQSSLASNRLSRLSIFSKNPSTLDLSQVTSEPPRQTPSTLRRIASVVRIRKSSRTEGELVRPNSVAPSNLFRRSSLGNLLSSKRWSQAQN